MNGNEKSDNCVVPTRSANKEGESSAEQKEGRRLAKGNTHQTTIVRTQSRAAMSSGLGGVREAARGNKTMQFTALLHHVNVDVLWESYKSLKRQAAPGIDGMTWAAYGEKLYSRLKRLHHRVQQGSYKAKPARRIYIPKADGTKRPLSIWSLEDKIVQQAITTVLNAIYEEDFIGFSYVFRPGRGQHDALDALSVGITRRKVNWVLDLWTERWRRRTATGDTIIVRYADDVVLGFQNNSDANRYCKELQHRLSEFGLNLHPKKTQLIRFGRFALQTGR